MELRETTTNINSHSTLAAGRGDPQFPNNLHVQTRRIANVRTYEAAGYRESAVSVDKMQMRLRFLEESNATMHLRNRDLIAENRSLARR